MTDSIKAVRQFTELTLKDAYGQYSARVEAIDLNIDQAVDYLVKSVLLAGGYDESTVNKRL